MSQSQIDKDLNSNFLTGDNYLNELKKFGPKLKSMGF